MSTERVYHFRGWKGMLSELPVTLPTLILPLDANPRIISAYAKELGMRFMWRTRPDGIHVWRVG